MNFLQPLEEIAVAAGKAILSVYAQDFDVEIKSDKSPVTEADMKAHTVIVERLRELTPDIPILSEESAAIPFGERRHWQRYWLVDPLDGTKEFIKRNGEFTVNIALIENGEPIVGVVHAPVTGTSYLGSVAGGAFRKQGNSTQAIHVQSSAPSVKRVVGSRSHQGKEVMEYLARLGAHEIVSMGSSLKLCLVAEGVADIYPRLGPTSEWDTAAGHAIVLAAGGHVVEAATGNPLRYNQKDSLLNPYFLVFGDNSIDWRKFC